MYNACSDLCFCHRLPSYCLSFKTFTVSQKYNGGEGGIPRQRRVPMFSAISPGRRGWDSNPRTPCGVNTLAGCCFQPLSHLSAQDSFLQYKKFFFAFWVRLWCRTHVRLWWKHLSRVLLSTPACRQAGFSHLSVFMLSRSVAENSSGGGCRIRTYERLAPLTVFKTAAFDHSANPPSEELHNRYLQPPLHSGAVTRPSPFPPLASERIYLSPSSSASLPSSLISSAPS